MFFRALVVVLALLPVVIAAPPVKFPTPRPNPTPAPPAAPAPEPAPELPRKKKTYTKQRATKTLTPAQMVEAYMPKVKAALATRWAEEVPPRMKEFTSGNLSVTFKLDSEGKVTGVAVTANTTNEPFAKFCDQFLRDTKFEPPPAGALADGQLEIPFTFTIY